MQTIQLISLRHSAFYTPYLMTFMGDFLSEQGLKAEYRCVADVNELENALLDGSAHVAQSAVGVSMRKIQPDSDSGQNQKILHFAQINQRDGFFLAESPRTHSEHKSSKNNVFDWHCLENKRVIADHLFQPMATFRYVLDKKSVDVSKVEFINAGNVQQSIAAFNSGQADYIHLQGPYPQQLASEGKVQIVASIGEALGEIAYSSLCATTAWLNSTMSQQFLSAYKAAMLYVNQTGAKQLAKQLLPLFESIHIDILSETIQAYKDLNSWSNSIKISERSFDVANRVFLFSGDIKSNIQYQQVVFNDF